MAEAAPGFKRVLRADKNFPRGTARRTAAAYKPLETFGIFNPQGGGCRPHAPLFGDRPEPAPDSRTG